MPKMTVSMDGVVIKEIELTQERTTLGRRPYNDIVIDNLAVSGEHAVFWLENEQARIEDLNSTNGTYVNGKAIKSEALQDNDQIEIGRYKIRFIQNSVTYTPTAAPSTDPLPTAIAPLSSTPVAAQLPPAKIRVLNGPSAGREAPLTKVVTTLGKPGVAVAAITHRGTGYTIAWIDGQVAPKVNGSEVGRDPRHLHPGDRIDLADIQMQFTQG